MIIPYQKGSITPILPKNVTPLHHALHQGVTRFDQCFQGFSARVTALHLFHKLLKKNLYSWLHRLLAQPATAFRAYRRVKFEYRCNGQKNSVSSLQIKGEKRYTWGCNGWCNGVTVNERLPSSQRGQK